MKRVLSGIFYTIIIILIAWFVLSYFDVVVHNLDSPTYKSWNLFQLLFLSL